MTDHSAPLLPPPDLEQDPDSCYYLKHEQVRVVFAREPGELTSREGPNRYAPGDAIITGSTGDRWVVSRARFDPKYEAVAPTRAGDDGNYRNKPVPVLAKQIPHPFRLARRAGGDILTGKPGDWVMQYAPGDYGVTENARFQSVYREYITLPPIIENEEIDFDYPAEAWKRVTLRYLSIVIGILCIVGGYTQILYHWTNTYGWIGILFFGFISARGLYISIYGDEYEVAKELGIKRINPESLPAICLLFGVIFALFAINGEYGWHLAYVARDNLQELEGEVKSIAYTDPPRGMPQINIYLQNENTLYHLCQLDPSRWIPTIKSLRRGDKVIVYAEHSSLNRDVYWLWELQRNGETLLSYDQTLTLFHDRSERVRPFTYTATALSVILLVLSVFLGRVRNARNLVR